MSSRSVLERPQTSEIKAILERVRVTPPLVFADAGRRHRTKIWDISPMFHCSIIGTCLTAAELRQFIGRLGDAGAKTLSDHEVHSRGVYIAGKRDGAARMLHKTIDKRHEAAVKRFTAAGTPDGLWELWQKALNAGDIPGAYWAVLTHPVATRAMIQDVFGEVHMLSHLVGSSNRLDIARLRKLEIELGESAGKIARQEARLQALSQDRSELLRRIGELESTLERQAALAQAAARTPAGPPWATALRTRLDAGQAHARALEARLKETEDHLNAAQTRITGLLAQSQELQLENSALEEALRIEAPAGLEDRQRLQDLDGLTLLYVGGRPKLVEQLKALTARRGGILLTHDGGVEDNPALLPGLISQADAAFFPVDCISHRAAGTLKKVCREVLKPFVPLRAASVASFIAEIGKADAAWKASGPRQCEA